MSKLELMPVDASLQDQVESICQQFVQLDNGAVILPTNTIHSKLDRRMTSVQDPYSITNIAHVDGNPRGRLSIAMAPGKKDGRWNRDLDMDLDVIAATGIEIIVCLLEWFELKMLSILDYPKKAQERGFIFYHMPIKDRRVAFQRDIDALVPIIVHHLLAGKSILVHCRGGLGRAGTICACCLGHFNYLGSQAIDTVRKQRPGSIQTNEQENCVLLYCGIITEDASPNIEISI